MEPGPAQKQLQLLPVKGIPGGWLHPKWPTQVEGCQHPAQWLDPILHPWFTVKRNTVSTRKSGRISLAVADKQTPPCCEAALHKPH